MSQDIMLQGFHWLSHEIDWYKIIKDNAQRIKDSGFTLMWFPPPSDSADQQGYLPRRLEVLDSKYGTAADLKAAINSIQPVKAIADIVINHRVGTTGYADFTQPTWSSYSVAQGDEYTGPKSFNLDTGESYHAARDLDHRNGEVSGSLISWMNNFLKNPNNAGFAGWRYDLVRGYAGWATELYNQNTQPAFSVGEYWDSDPQKVVNWIDSTHPNPVYCSRAFDFPLR